MEDLADLGVRGEERRDLRRRRRAAGMRLAGGIERRDNGRGPPPVEHAATHGDEIHYRVGKRRIVGGEVSPHVAVVAAKRLGAAGDDDVDAVLQGRNRKRPRRGDRRVEDQADAGHTLARGGHHGAELIEVLRADQRVGERLSEHEPRLRRDRRRQRCGIAIVHHRDRAADASGQPVQVATGLVVDLSHQHRVRARSALSIVAGLHQHIESERCRLHT